MHGQFTLHVHSALFRALELHCKTQVHNDDVNAMEVYTESAGECTYNVNYMFPDYTDGARCFCE